MWAASVATRSVFGPMLLLVESQEFGGREDFDFSTKPGGKMTSVSRNHACCPAGYGNLHEYLIIGIG
jgi:hypothetical protein